MPETTNKSNDDRKIFRNLRSMVSGRSGGVKDSLEFIEGFKRFVGDKDTLKYQKDRLQIGVGAFIFVDPETRRVVQLFRERAVGEVGVSYPLEYSWFKGPGGIKKDLLDEMFFQWRKAETLLERDQGGLYWWPEYYSYLPGNAVEQHDSHCEFWINEGCHYCPWGEVLFYMLAWRLLLRIAQTHGWDASVAENLPDLKPSKTQQRYKRHSIWTNAMWPGESSRENWWHEHLRNLSAEVEPAWLEIMKQTDDAGEKNGGWPTDWETLQLLKADSTTPSQFQAGEALLPLLAYCTELAQCEQNKRIASEMRASLHSDATMAASVLPKLNSLVQQVILDTLAKSKDVTLHSVTAADGLAEVHRRATFPILPYFYWSAIDPAPRTHMVIPVWHSTADPVELPWQSHPVKEESRSQREGRQASSTVVGVAVIGLQPFADYDQTCKDVVGKATDLDAANVRFDLVRNYFELLALPLVDLYLIRKQSAKTDKVYKEAQKALFESAMHRIWNLRYPLKILLHTLQNLPDSSGLGLDTLKQLATAGGVQLNILARLPKRLRHFATTSDREVIDLPAYIDEFATGLREDYSMDVQVKNLIRDKCVVFGRRGLLWCILDELSYNAHKAIERRNVDEPTLVFRLSEYPHGRYQGQVEQPHVVRLVVEDNGSGIPPDLAESIFESGFSTSTVEGASGFGLWQVRHLIEEEFGGTIRADRERQCGAAFTIEIPRTSVKEEM